MHDYIGAIDQGTTSTRFIVFDRAGRIVSTAQEEHEQIYPKPGWVEHDPAEIWRRAQTVIKKAMETGGFGPRDLAAIGITNQRETTVVWNKKTGKKVPTPGDPSVMMEQTSQVVPPQYNTKSTLTYEVTSGTNTKDFELKSH